MRSTRVSRSACERREESANRRNSSWSIEKAAGCEGDVLESPSYETMRPALAGWQERKGTTRGRARGRVLQQANESKVRVFEIPDVEAHAA
jgi:hypothetical protein